MVSAWRSYMAPVEEITQSFQHRKEDIWRLSKGFAKSWVDWRGWMSNGHSPHETSGYQMRPAGFRLQANRRHCIVVDLFRNVYMSSSSFCHSAWCMLRAYKGWKPNRTFLYRMTHEVLGTLVLCLWRRWWWNIVLRKYSCLLLDALHPFLMLCWGYLLWTTWAESWWFFELR